jgi:hypothetical protein
MSEDQLASILAPIIVIGILVIIFALFKMLGSYRASRREHKCYGCSETFKLSFWEEFWSLTYAGRTYKKCPKCGKRTWSKIVIWK